MAKPSMASMPCAVPPMKWYRMPMPNSPIDATVRPMIEPPKKATFSASAAPLLLAATAVRTFALVAVYMPI